MMRRSALLSLAFAFSATRRCLPRLVDRARSRSSRRSARPARTSSGCRRRRPWSTRCSTWRRSRKTDFVMDLGSGDGRTVITAAKRGARAFGIEYNPDMVDVVAEERDGGRRRRSRDVREGRPLRDRPVEGGRDHDVPAAVDQPEAASEDPRPQARHAHRLEHLHDGRLAGRRDRRR